MGAQIMVIATLLLSCVLAACGLPPTGPTLIESGLVLRVGAGVTTLKIGDREPLQAFVRDSSGAERKTTATWAVEDESITRLSETEALAAISPGVTTIRATAEGFTATQQITVVNTFDGEWTGAYKIEECSRLSGAGSSYCRFVLGGSLYIRLELVQRGAALSGEIVIGDNLGNPTARGTVSGQVNVSGQASLSATARSITDQPGANEFAGWISELSPDGRLVGRFTKTRSFTNAFGPQTSREECRLEDLTRSS